MRNTKQDIIEHVSALIYPRIDDVIKTLKPEDIDSFIHHIAMDLERSLKHWNFKTNSYSEN